MPTSYPWERRWLEISASKAASEPFHQVESTGYVAATEWTEQQTELIGIPLAQLINDRQVVVLLGEPGIGKSSEWRKLGDQLANDKQHLFLNLGSFAANPGAGRPLSGGLPFLPVCPGKNGYTIFGRFYQSQSALARPELASIRTQLPPGRLLEASFAARLATGVAAHRRTRNGRNCG